MWIIAIGFMNYGICWRTVLAFGFVVVFKWMFYGYALRVDEQRKRKPVIQTEPEIPNDI